MLKPGKPCIMEAFMPGRRLTEKTPLLEVHVAIALEFKDSSFHSSPVMKTLFW